MEVPSVQDLDGLKYSELQKLAKQAGLKANLKADRLLKALKKHFHPDALPEQISDNSDGNWNLNDNDESQSWEEKEEHISTCHVIHRMGQHFEETQKESVSTVKSLKAGETDIFAHMSQCDQIQENNLKDKEVARPGYAKRERKRQRPTDTVSGKTKETSPAAKVLRHKGRLSRVVSKSSTPNFKKLHEAHFKKMESIDKYMERKQKRLEAVSSSIHEVKMMAMNSNLLTEAEKTPVSSSEVCDVGYRFSEITKDNEHKRSLIKTPTRKSSCFKTPESKTRRSFPQHKTEPVSNADKDLKLCVTDLESEESKSLLNKKRSAENKMNQSATTPFKFTAQLTETPNTNKKFDLQASLARPLGYQPHKGKLKPWGQAKENHASNKNTVSAMKDSFKQPILPTRDDRRKRHKEDRKLKRDKAVGTRRGILME
ncbi:nucleolar and spindle-associated protein 1 [Pyxicephalus adspersus]|uniref:nucleolar and spindle-associated protein 1 n=1 Tax=Pyxicephalus adspersus TaxID=30357 RepID=UPI003B59B5E2